MSSRCTSAVFERYPVGGGEFALALALADNAHDDGTHIFPSVETMARKSRQSVRAVQMHLRRMVEVGWLQRTSAGRGGRGVATEYRINPAWLKGAEIAPFSEAVDIGQKGAISAPFEPEKGCNPRQKRVQNDAQKGAKHGTPYITGGTVIEPNPPTPQGGADADSGFEAFWAGYPRQVGKASAQAEWEKLSPDHALQQRIASAVRAWARSPEWKRNEGQFVPKPAKWLREQNWEGHPGGQVAPAPAAPAPVMGTVHQLTPEQLEANKAKAVAAAERARSLLGGRAARPRKVAA